MKTTYHILATLALATTLSACDSYLDIKPKGERIPETASDYRSMLSHSNIQKIGETYPVYLTDDCYLPDSAVNTATPGLNTITPYLKRLYTFDKEVFGDGEDDTFWFSAYSRIFTNNVVVREVMKATEGTNEEKNAIRGEALVNRALDYLYLVNGYAKHYNEATADNDPGVPLLLDADISQTNLTRASVKSVYQQILADLNEAEKALPAEISTNAFHASKDAARGLLARTLLYLGNYADALKAANEVIARHDTLLNLTQYAVVKPNGMIGRTNVPDADANPESIFIKYAPYIFGVSSKVFPSDTLLNMYPGNDMRMALFMPDKYRGTQLTHAIWAPFVRANTAISTPEMFLIAAECEARVGNAQRAMALINKLRDHRIHTNTHVVLTDKDSVLNFVLAERRRELAFNGFTRLVDLKRLNLDPRFATTVKHVGANETWVLMPNDPKYVLPIPQKVMRFNANSMTQNER